MAALSIPTAPGDRIEYYAPRSVADKNERAEFLTSVMRGLQIGTQPHHRYPEIQVPVIPNVMMRLKACEMLGKINGDYVVRVEDVTDNHAQKLIDMKKVALAIEQDRCIDGEFSEVSTINTNHQF